MRITLLIALIVIISSIADAQTGRRARPKVVKPVAAAPTPTPSEPAEAPVVVKTEPKRNQRPASNGNNAAAVPKTEPTHFYEFAQPEFHIRKIVIEHDDTGKGTITFTKKMFDETVSDPLQVSAAALERIDAAYAALNFLDSNENYQYEKDYSHLGVTTFRLKRGDKQRTAVFNYTVNKDAKTLADEYRKLGNQFVWIFEITLARENQPLESPRLLDSLDSLVRRNEISDPVQMIPLLTELSNDERIPLIARNHSAKLVARIEKGKK